MTDVYRTYIDEITRDYARSADAAKADDNPRSIVSLSFRDDHESLSGAFDLGTGATPDHVIIAVYAYCKAHGCEATFDKISDSPKISRAWFAFHSTR